MGRDQKDFTCVAVDMGAASIRVMLGVISEEGISYQEIHRIVNETVFKDGHDRWNIEHIVREIRVGIGKALEASKDAPSSIGVDAWGVDYVLLDHQGELVETPIAYRDPRTQGMEVEWESLMPRIDTYRRTGINFYIFNTLYQLLSSRKSDLLKRSSKILFIPCYINYILSAKSYNELSISSTSQLLKVRGNHWDNLIINKLGINKDLLGEVISPGTLLGPVIIPEARNSRMECIAVCGHDTACVVAAIPVDSPNYAFISAGTWCVVGLESETPVLSEDALHLGLTNERGYRDTYRILKNIVGLWLVQGLKKHLPEHTSYAEMEQMTLTAGSIMQVIDPDDPGFYNPVDMKEAFAAYFLKTGQKIPESFSAYLLCAYDSLCFSFKYHLEKLEQLSGRLIEVIHVVGGGSQSDYLNQRIATLCNRKVISGPVEGATLGNMLIQAMTMGRIKSIQEGRALVKKSFPGITYLPGKEPEHAKKRYQQFLLLKKSVKTTQDV